MIDISDLPEEILTVASDRKRRKRHAIDDIEKYRQLLNANNGNVAQVARALKEPKTTVHSRLKSLGLI